MKAIFIFVIIIIFLFLLWFFIVITGLNLDDVSAIIVFFIIFLGIISIIVIQDIGTYIYASFSILMIILFLAKPYFFDVECYLGKENNINTLSRMALNNILYDIKYLGAKDRVKIRYSPEYAKQVCSRYSNIQKIVKKRATIDYNDLNLSLLATKLHCIIHTVKHIANIFNFNALKAFLFIFLYITTKQVSIS